MVLSGHYQRGAFGNGSTRCCYSYNKTASPQHGGCARLTKPNTRWARPALLCLTISDPSAFMIRRVSSARSVTRGMRTTACTTKPSHGRRSHEHRHDAWASGVFCLASSMLILSGGDGSNTDVNGVDGGLPLSTSFLSVRPLW
eukprot:scaffold8032_cov136-Isochrysis_galbana.AAC.2